MAVSILMRRTYVHDERTEKLKRRARAFPRRNDDRLRRSPSPCRERAHTYASNALVQRRQHIRQPRRALDHPHMATRRQTPHTCIDPDFQRNRLATATFPAVVAGAAPMCAIKVRRVCQNVIKTLVAQVSRQIEQVSVHNPCLNRIQPCIILGKPYQLSLTLEPSTDKTRYTMQQAIQRHTDTAADIQNALARLRLYRRREKHRIHPRAIAVLGLTYPQPPVEKAVFRDVVHTPVGMSLSFRTADARK